MNNYFDANHPMRPYTHSAPANSGTTPPRNALRGEIPAMKEGFHPSEKNGEWIYIEDHRGEIGYLDGQETELVEIGEYPDGWSESPAPLMPEELAKERSTEIRVRLNQLDLDSIRPLRATVEGTSSDEDRGKLSEIEVEIVDLRIELAVLVAAWINLGGHIGGHIKRVSNTHKSMCPK